MVSYISAFTCPFYKTIFGSVSFRRTRTDAITFNIDTYWLILWTLLPLFIRHSFIFRILRHISLTSLIWHQTILFSSRLLCWSPWHVEVIGLPKLGSMQRVISRKRRHTQKLLEESLNPTSSGYDSNSVASTSASSDGNCSISDLLQTAERLQFLFTPSGGKTCDLCHFSIISIVLVCRAR